ncbi:MAG: hypothetical protein AB2L24_16870 [Mangrovibacterium sp.]
MLKGKKTKKKVSLIFFLIMTAGMTLAEETSWWPKQQVPKTIVVCGEPSNAADMNLAQSLSGLAAQALNDGMNAEGVWIDSRSHYYKEYFQSLIERTGVRKGGNWRLWPLVEHFKKAGIVKGYILYDLSKADNTVNLATVYASILKGILIDVSQQKTADDAGLELLFDMTAIREVTDEEFNKVKGQLNNNLITIINPQVSNNRDYAIAHKSMVYYGVDSLLEHILEWVKPISPVIGWNSGPESGHIEPCTRWGLLNTASDWCQNLPMMSLESKYPADDLYQYDRIDPGSIDWNKHGNYHSFVMSDGDNMQWTFGGFLDSPDYWNNPFNKELKMSFTTCGVNLSMAGKDVLRKMVTSQQTAGNVVEYGGGYYYPDLFASARGDREELLREFAGIVNEHMKKRNLTVFGFICKDVFCEEAKTAYKIFAEELETLTGMIAVQYFPYNGGYGDIIWTENKEGLKIPVVTATNMVWADAKMKNSGNPRMVANDINNQSKSGDAMGWTVVHAWSHFSKDEQGCIRDDSKKQIKDSVRGVTPLAWGARYIDQTELIPIEELLWRIRMKYEPEQTKNYLSK